MFNILTNPCQYNKLDNSTFEIYSNKIQNIYVAAMTKTQFDLAEIINEDTYTYHFKMNQLNIYNINEDEVYSLKIMHFLLFGI